MFYAQLCWVLHFPRLKDFRSLVSVLHLHVFFMPFKSEPIHIHAHLFVDNDLCI